MAEEGFYFVERCTEHFLRSIKIDRVLYEGYTPYQFVQIVYNRLLGKTLFLDRKMQSAEIDECVFHESLVHPALVAHPDPIDVLILGGGEGATLREALRHGCVRKATMVDIDRKLVRLCEEFLPGWSRGAFSDARARVVFGDAQVFLKKCRSTFDVVISDLTEPIPGGPSVSLFTLEFFQRIQKALRKGGVFVLQAGSADVYYYQFFLSLVRTLQEVFPVVRPYWAYMFSFGMPWGFVTASAEVDPLETQEKELRERLRTRKVRNLRYYHPGLHRGMFALPLYLIKGMKKAKVLTDKQPFIWEL